MPMLYAEDIYDYSDRDEPEKVKSMVKFGTVRAPANKVCSQCGHIWREHSGLFCTHRENISEIEPFKR